MSEFADYVHEQLADLGEIEYGRFFGGTAFKLGGTQFAMLMDNTFYLVVDDDTRKKYIETGSVPFSYATKNGRRLVHRYYQVPDEIVEDRDALMIWAQEAIEAAVRSNRSKKRGHNGATSP